MENEMIERVAKAIAPYMRLDADGTGARLAAEAAIEEMRDRNEAMLDAGTAVLWPHVQKLAPGSTAVAVYEAMIDAALGRTAPKEPEIDLTAGDSSLARLVREAPPLRGIAR